MAQYQPALAAGEVSKNVRGFLRAHKDHFHAILKPLLPWLIGFSFLDIIIHLNFFPEKDNFMLFGLLNSYLYMALAVNWHRTVILGPNNYIPVDLMHPKRHELAFLGVGLAITIAAFGIGLLAGIPIFLLSVAMPFLILPLLLALFIGAVWLVTRLMLYFPAKAVDQSITLQESYAMTKGYVWKMWVADFYATWRVILVFVAYMVVWLIIAGSIVAMFGVGPEKELSMGPTLILYVLALPMEVYFTPLLATIWVNILSNYYLIIRRGA